MFAEEEEGVKKYLNSVNLLQYSQKKDLEPKEDDFFARINQKKRKKTEKMIQKKKKKIH